MGIWGQVERTVLMLLFLFPSLYSDLKPFLIHDNYIS